VGVDVPATYAAANTGGAATPQNTVRPLRTARATAGAAVAVKARRMSGPHIITTSQSYTGGT